MKTIYKGNNFVIQWSIMDAVTSLPFDFNDMFVEFVVYSENYNGRISGCKITGNKMQAEIMANTLPIGVYDLVCSYRNSINSGHCICRRAFNITRNPGFCSNTNKIVIESHAAPLRLENMDINYLGHFPSEGMLPDSDRPAWSLVGTLKFARPWFYYTPGTVPPGYQSGWNDLSEVLGTYDLTADKVSIFDFNLVTEYNVSRNHPNIKRDFSKDWGVSKLFYPEYEEYRPCKVYDEGEHANMPDYTGNTFIALRETSQPPFITIEVSSEFTLDEAVAITPEQYRYPGIRLTFVNSGTHQAETWFWLGGEWENEDEWIKPSDGVTINNLPDEEDISATNDAIPRLQLKDKEYNKSSFSGLGRVYLRKNIVNGINALDKNLFLKANTRYIIQYDYDLNGGTVEIPENCVLQFDGGSISNGTMVGSNTIIEAGLVKVFGTDVTIKGVWNIECWYPEWFGAVSGNESIMSTDAIRSALAAARGNINTVKLTGANYYIDDTLMVYSGQSLVGASSSVHHYGGITINQTVNKHAIQLTSTDVNVWQICLKDFTVNNKYNGRDMNNCGIIVYNGDVRTGFFHSEIENVCCTYFDAGFMYDGYGDGAFAYNTFNTFAAYYNKIGLYIKGNASSDTSDTKYPWCNLNRWDFCKFMNNSIGGIYFHNTRSQQENIFESCAIEGSGYNYALTDYEKYGGAGWAFRGNNQFCYGFTRFYNCYVEDNFPKRVNDLSYDDGKEYVFNNTVYPKDIESNVKNSSFVCFKQNVEVASCLLSKYVRLFAGVTEFSTRFEKNDYDLGLPWYNTLDKITVDHFFHFNWSNGMRSYCSQYINEWFPKGDRDYSYGTYLTQMKAVFRLGDSANNLGVRGTKIKIVHPLLEEPIIYGMDDIEGNDIVDSGVIYIDPKNPNTNLGSTKIQPIGDFTSAEQVSSFYRRGKEVKWVLLSDYTKRSDNWTPGGNNHNVYLRGEGTILYKSVDTYTVYTPYIIENINFDTSIKHQHIFESHSDKIEFRNCNFNVQTSNYYIARLINGGDIKFINCSFNLIDKSEGNTVYVQHPNYKNSKLTFSNCNVTDGCILANNTYYYSQDTFVAKGLGDVMLYEGNKYCEYDGADVINPDGTLVKNVWRIKSIAEMDKSGHYYKIVKDIDLNGESVSIPWYCKLDFQGGRFINGTISFSNARLMPMGMPLSYYIDTETCSIGDNFWAEGQVLYDSELKKQKLWNGTSWVNLDGTPLTATTNTVEEQTE